MYPLPAEHPVLAAMNPQWTLLKAVPLMVVSVSYIFLAACTEAPRLPDPPAVRVPADRGVQEDAIREAIFRYLIKTKGPLIRQLNLQGPIFLYIDGKDPSSEFMERFAGSKLRVKKGSGSYFKKYPFPGWLRDKSTGQKALSLSVRDIAWITIMRVEVKGGTYCGGLCGDGGVFRVVRRNSHWTVEGYEVHVVF